MQNQNPEIFFVIVIGSILALLLVGFIVTILFLYQRRQHRQEQELVKMKDIYEQEVLRSQLEIQENTFKTIGQELHDNIGQLLSVVKLSLSILPLDKEHAAYEPVQNSGQILNKAIVDLSHLTKGLYTDRIAQVGLVESIRFELESLRKAGLLQVEFSTTGQEVHLHEQKSIFLFRIFQEMINNMLKHSKATRVIVTLIYSRDDNFVLRVEDNGVGFHVAEMLQSTSSVKGVGLRSMFNRAKLMGADLTIDSLVSKGTITTVKLPLPQQSE